jgi:hypothetical protein
MRVAPTRPAVPHADVGRMVVPSEREQAMQQNVRARGDVASPNEGALPLTEPLVGERPQDVPVSGSAPSTGVTSVSAVPSEQLWRAAVLAAREAALAAAELRRTFDARRAIE